MPLVGETHDHERWYLGDVRLKGLDRNHIHIWTSPEGMVGVTPLPKSDIWQLQATIPAEIKDPEEPTLEVYQAMFDRRASGMGFGLWMPPGYLSTVLTSAWLEVTVTVGYSLRAMPLMFIRQPAVRA